MEDDMIGKLFPRNEHRIERGARIILGLVLLSLVFLGPRTYWGLLGVVPLVTGLVGSCPLYTMFGVSTCPLRSSRTPGDADAPREAKATE
jgi:hypothetical protein